MDSDADLYQETEERQYMSNMDSDAEHEHELDEENVQELIIPDCGALFKPFMGQIFDNLDVATASYFSYAKACGFKVRKSTLIKANDGTVKTRYLVCSREGLKETYTDDFVDKKDLPKQKRRRVSTRIDCKARIVFMITYGNRYKVHIFVEGHSHPMIPHDHRHMMSSNRNVDQVHQLFIMSSIKANIGPSKSYRLFSELSGGDENVGCLKIDFKNYARDLRVAVYGVDAHVLLQNFKRRQENNPDFKFFYDLDESNNLRRLFWADEKSVRYFSLFGDAVALDATYGSNRYKMIFTPFTGKDNHGCCVTLGAAIISREDVESYSWVLQRFIKCMGSHPKVLTTDQDPALRKAVAAVLPNTSHRFCMWHITMKISEKLPVALRDDSDFRKKLNQIIWSDDCEIEAFEEKWLNLIREYGLNEHRWFRDMYVDRRFWIPAYFRDIHMSGIFRTTSMSESENSFFRSFFSKNADLVRLFMHYCTAMDAQRNSFKRMTMADEAGAPDFLTELQIERHAASVYTNKIFNDVQVEIVAAARVCIMSRMYTERGDNMYDVDDIVDGIFSVRHTMSDDYISCSCKLFTRKGLPCRHMFFVMRNIKMKKIPDKYIIPRWTKWSRLSTKSGTDKGVVSVSQKTNVGNSHLFVVFAKCLASVHSNEDLSGQLYSEMTEMAGRFVQLGLSHASDDEKQHLFEQFYGGPIPDIPDIGSPGVSHTKGSGCGGRLISAREKAIRLSQKAPRNCSICKSLQHHDARTCPNRKKPANS